MSYHLVFAPPNCQCGKDAPNLRDQISLQLQSRILTVSAQYEIRIVMLRHSQALNDSFHSSIASEIRVSSTNNSLHLG